MTEPGYRIRPAREEEAACLSAIEQAAAVRFAAAGHPEAAAGGTLAPEVLSETLRQGRLWVAVTAQELPVGFALAAELDGLAYLQEMDVLPEHGRRGLGRRLVECVCAWAERSGYAAVVLTTFRDVPWNGPFYARAGFTELPPADWTPSIRRVVQEELEAGFANRIVMRRALASAAAAGDPDGAR
jgi:GNAT superfamily N-acetyltransferase